MDSWDTLFREMQELAYAGVVYPLLRAEPTPEEGSGWHHLWAEGVHRRRLATRALFRAPAPVLVDAKLHVSRQDCGRELREQLSGVNEQVLAFLLADLPETLLEWAESSRVRGRRGPAPRPKRALPELLAYLRGGARPGADYVGSRSIDEPGPIGELIAVPPPVPTGCDDELFLEPSPESLRKVLLWLSGAERTFACCPRHVVLQVNVAQVRARLMALDAVRQVLALLSSGPVDAHAWLRQPSVPTAVVAWDLACAAQWLVAEEGAHARNKARSRGYACYGWWLARTGETLTSCALANSDTDGVLLGQVLEAVGQWLELLGAITIAREEEAKPLSGDVPHLAAVQQARVGVDRLLSGGQAFTLQPADWSRLGRHGVRAAGAHQQYLLERISEKDGDRRAVPRPWEVPWRDALVEWLDRALTQLQSLARRPGHSDLTVATETRLRELTDTKTRITAPTASSNEQESSL